MWMALAGLRREREDHWTLGRGLGGRTRQTGSKVRLQLFETALDVHLVQLSIICNASSQTFPLRSIVICSLELLSLFKQEFDFFDIKHPQAVPSQNPIPNVFCGASPTGMFPTSFLHNHQGRNARKHLKRGVF